MKRVFLVKQLLVLLAGFVGINLVAASRAHRSVPRVLMHAIDSSPPVNDLFLGNSLMEAGLDVTAYQDAAHGPKAFNAALGASTPVEHDLLLRRAARLHPQRLFYGFFDTQLTEKPIADFAELGGNRAIVHYLDRETAIRFLCPDDALTAWRIRLVSWLPVVVERLSWWSKVERVRRRLSRVGLPEQTTNAFGRAADFALLEADDTRRFARQCGELAERGAALNAPVADMLALAQGSGATFCFVEMPMTSSHRRRFYDTPEWTAYEAAIRKQAGESGTRFVNAADWVDDDGFEDPLHLNPRGAALFSRKLAASPNLGQ